MKKVFLFTLLFSAYFCSAQNYQCLQSGVKHYFINGNGYLRGIRIDTVKTVGSDIEYFPYKTFRNSSLPLDTTNGSWLGGHVIQKTDGSFFSILFLMIPLSLKH